MIGIAEQQTTRLPPGVEKKNVTHFDRPDLFSNISIILEGRGYTS
jgi:hypothetical protein